MKTQGIPLRVLLWLCALHALPTIVHGQTTVSGAFTGVPLGNVAHVVMTADVNLNNFEFDLGPQGIYAHNWWYSPGTGFTNMTAVVTGSTTAVFNGVFQTNAFNWLRIYSNSATPQAAMSDGNSFADLGASYAVDYAPSDAGIGELQLGAVQPEGGPAPGEHVTSEGIAAAVPEPATATLLLSTACAAFLWSARRRSR
jgi:hypothetical protein